MSIESPVNQIDSLIKLLITPATVIPEKLLSQTNVFSVCEFLKSSLNSATLCIESEANLSWLKSLIDKIAIEGPAEDVCWRFTKTSLQLLMCLCSQLKSARKKYIEKMKNQEVDGQAASLPPDILSIQQQKNVQSMLQFIACLGISRNLLPGVGASIEQRSKFGSLLVSGDNQEVSDFDKYQMLYSTVYALNKCSEHPALGSLIFTSHLGDILAALCQLSYVPLKEVPESVLKMRRTASELLSKLIENTYQPMVIRELLLLHRSAPSNSRQTGTPRHKNMRWLTKATQKMLSERLVKEQGVLAVIRGILDFNAVSAQSTPNDWAQCDVIARLIASCITSSSNKDACSELICPQILALLNIEEVQQFAKIASLTIMAVALADPTLAQQHLINPVIEPLLMCCHYEETNHCKPSENELFSCVNNLHKIFVVGPDPNEKFVEFLCPVLSIIIDMFALSCSGISYVRTLLEEIVCFFLKHADRRVALNSLKEFLCPFDTTTSTALHLNPKLKFVHGSSGGIAVCDVTCSESDEISWMDDDQVKIAALVDLLSQVQKDVIVVDFFLSVLQDLTMLIHENDADLRVDKKGCGRSDELLRIEETQLKDQQHVRKSLLIVQTLSSLCRHPTLQESIMKDKSQIIQFLKVTFERGSKCCDSALSGGEMEAETLTLSMTMLSMVIDGKETPEIKLALKSCLDSLGILSQKHPSGSVRSLAEELVVAIMSHGVVATSEKATRQAGAINSANPAEKSAGKSAGSPYQQAWEDLLDPEPSTRGHALLVVSKLIKSRNEEAMKNREELIMVLQESLNHEDSYVYLMAVRAFESLASVFPGSTLKYLIEQYSNTDLPTSPELKMKVGEVLVKVTRTLGEVIPKYRERLLGAFLSATKHADEHVRASSLSNLGEVCKGLRYSMGPCVHQIFSCLTSYIKYDSSLEVRRAAAQVFTLMLRGMGKDALKILESQIKDIYRLLKFIYETDKDDVVKLHVQLALEELDIICRDFLFPKLPMEKKITVLNPN